MRAPLANASRTSAQAAPRSAEKSRATHQPDHAPSAERAPLPTGRKTDPAKRVVAASNSAAPNPMPTSPTPSWQLGTLALHAPGGSDSSPAYDMTLQRKLAVGRNDHPLEQEAELVADHVVSHSSSPPPAISRPGAAPIRRRCAACDKDEKEGLVQAKGTGNAPPASAPPVVHALLQTPGRALDAPTQAFFEQRFQRDFSQVRIHTDDHAARATTSLSAQAFTAGEHIAFNSGRYAPHTDSGKHLLAHELTHVVQQAGASANTVRRAPEDVPELDRKLQAAIADKDWSAAAETLNAFSEEDILKRIGRMKKGDVASLHQGALDNKQLGEKSQVAVLTHKSWLDLNFNNEVKSEHWDKAAELLNGYSDTDIDAKLITLSKPQLSSLRIAAPTWATRITSRIDAIITTKDAAEARQRADATQAQAVNDAVASMSNTDKLGKAVDYAKETFHDDVRKEIEGLFSPTAIIAMAAFVALYLAAQLTPAGWVADALAIATIAVSAIFLGATLFEIIKDLIKFGAAINATTDKQLQDSGAALARALAKAGVTIIVALLTHGAKGAAKPYIDSPPTGFADAVTVDGMIVRAPVQAIPVPKSAAVSMAATAPMAAMSTNGGGGGGDKGADDPQKKSPSMTARSDGLRPNEVALIKKARKFFQFPDAPTPEEPGIVGVLIPEEGGAPIEIKSGVEGGPSGGVQRGNVPRGPGSGLDRYTSGHVEGHAAAIMRERGIKRAVLLMEKYFCPNCDKNFTQALPKGSKVLVVFPDSAETVVSTEM